MGKPAKKTHQTLRVATANKSVRKYPNVLWFPRSKTDPKEIREVLKIAYELQAASANSCFNDRILGEEMARRGIINVLGLDAEEYVKAYKKAKVGDQSYVTNARMLMRLFRFLGLASRKEAGAYVLTERGKLYTDFSGDFPCIANGVSEEGNLLQALGDFAFYCVNDDPTYRDGSFKTRPFVWLLRSLKLEPQCIYQLIVTAFASKSESGSEIARMTEMLAGMRSGKTNLSNEWRRLGLDPDDYSCVRNFYDSAKILVYLGVSLGLIKKGQDAEYGARIVGKARHLKSSTTFYSLTEKGERYLDEQAARKLVFFDDLLATIGDRNAVQSALLLCCLNFSLGNRRTISVHASLLKDILGEAWREVVDAARSVFSSANDGDWYRLDERVSFSFWQSIPPEFFFLPQFIAGYETFVTEFKKDKSALINFETTMAAASSPTDVMKPFFRLDGSKGASYEIPALNTAEAEGYVRYPIILDTHGGQDRFATRVSPTDTLRVIGGRVYVDNSRDALDLIAPLRHPDTALRQFISNNLAQLLRHFMEKSDTWEKDQHYTWVRNALRLFGAEAIYSGSSGMLARADVSVIKPFIGGIEAKSPRENRGSINTKAVRQAVDAKIQVSYIFDRNHELTSGAIAIGRRITNRAIEEERRWSGNGQPVLMINDATLYYLALRSCELNFSSEVATRLFTSSGGALDTGRLTDFITEIAPHASQKRLIGEISLLEPYMHIG